MLKKKIDVHKSSRCINHVSLFSVFVMLDSLEPGWPWRHSSFQGEPVPEIVSNWPRGVPFICKLTDLKPTHTHPHSSQIPDNWEEPPQS